MTAYQLRQVFVNVDARSLSFLVFHARFTKPDNVIRYAFGSTLIEGTGRCFLIIHFETFHFLGRKYQSFCESNVKDSI